MSEQAGRPARVQEALDFFRTVEDAEHDQRAREQEALQFQVPEYAWTDDVKQARQAQTVNGIPLPARPMISIPWLDQPIQLNLNAERRAHLGVQVHALTEDASDDTAEVMRDLYRTIEVDSRAGLARSWGHERSVKAGRGAYRVLKVYDPSGGHPSDQKLVIKRILDQGRAYFDPFAQEPDFSDGERALVVDDVPWRTYQRLYPESTLASYTDSEFEGLGSETDAWMSGDTEESRKIRVAEFFYVEHRRETVRWTDAEGQPQSRPDDRRQVKWCKLNAIEILEEGEWEGELIPLIPTIGRELIPFQGQRRWEGMYGPQKDAVRLANYAASAAIETSALEPKAPFDVDPEEIEGLESWWQQANLRNFPYLPRRKFLHGQVMAPVQRIQADTSKLQVNVMLLQQAKDFIHTGTGAFEPTLGQETRNVKSGRMTLALQQQHEEGNSNWLDNLSEISMTLEARIIIEMMPFVYDRPGRIARLLDLENTPRMVMLNQPFVAGPDGRPQPIKPGEQVAGAKHYNLRTGKYGVTVSIGKGYKSRVEQGQDQLGQLFQAEPQLFQLLGDLWLKFTDFPGHMEAAERIKKMLPPQLQQDQGPEAAAQQATALKAQVQQLTAQLQQAVEYVKTEQAKHAAQVQIAGIKAETDKVIAEANNATKVLVARITAAKDALDADMAAKEELLATGLQHAHEATEAEKDRQHERATLDQQHRIATAQAQQDTLHQGALAEQAHGQALEAGDASHRQALEQGEQAGQQQLEQLAATPQPATTP